MPRPERPIDSADDGSRQFALALRELRRQGGGLTYRQLAERTGFSASTLADAASGRRLPTLEVTLAYAVACGGDEQEWTARWQEAAGTEPVGERAPFRGLRGFRYEDADLFFGRAVLVAEVERRVLARPVTVVLGASGAGKSSLLAAGVLPALCADPAAPVRPVLTTPGERPDLLRDLDAEQVPDGTTLVLVVDQFEQLYTLCAAEDRARFIDGALALAERPNVRLVVSVRADFYGRCAEHPGLAEALRDNQVLVGPMNADELREAMTRPAAAVGLSLERALLVSVVREADGRTGVLPLLSHAMLETWRLRRGTVLTLAGFEAAGGINGAVVRTAETAYRGLAPDEQDLAAELLLRLLAVEEANAVTRRRVGLAAILGVDPKARTVIDRLAAARLVAIDGDSVELAHEAIVTAWPRLDAWIADHRDAVRAHHTLGEATRIWLENERDSSALATGARLELMRGVEVAVAGILRLSGSEKEFLDESKALARRTRLGARRRARRLRAITAAAVAAAVLAGVLAVVSANARSDALAARDVALAGQVALTAQKLRESDPAIAAQLAIAGYRTAQTTETRSALLESSASPAPTRYLGGAGPTALAVSVQGSGLIATSNATNGTVQLFTTEGARLARSGVFEAVEPGRMVYALALSPDDHLLAIGDNRANVSLWDVADPAAPVLKLGPFVAMGPVERLVFASDGTELAAAGGNEVTRWALDGRGKLASVPSPSPVKTVTYDPRGGALAFGTERGTVHLWTLGDEPAQTAVLQAGERLIPAVSFSPDGRTLVAGSHDSELRVWDLSSSPRLVRTLTGLFDLKITTTAFSPDGHYLLAGSTDSTLVLVETTTWTRSQDLPHPDVVTWAAFTGDGTAVVSVATDGALRRWLFKPPPLMPAAILDTRFTPDGSRLAVFAEGTFAVWKTPDTAPPLVPPTAAPEGSPAFSGAGDISHDGGLVAAGTMAGTVLFMDVSNPGSPLATTDVPPQMEGPQEVLAVAFSPDGTLLAVGGRDGAVSIWDVTEPRQPRLRAIFRTPEDVVLSVEWKPDSRLLAVASADARVYLVDLDDPDVPHTRATLDGLSSYVYTATFTPDGNRIAIGGVDGTVLLWDVRDPGRPKRIGPPIAGPSSRILQLAFHPTKPLLAASVIDGTVWLWDTSDAEHPTRTAVLAPTNSPLSTGVFRPTGDLLLAAGGDRTVRTWRTDTEAVITDLCAGIGDPITEQEWRTHLPDLPYRPPCRA
jgi:WD40 repeat protein/transcriptional regulator with XRE-family HTH domain